MKMKIRCSLLLLLLFGSSVVTNAGNGIKRSDWDYRPEITIGNVVYGTLIFAVNPFVANLLTKTRINSNVSRDDLPWWYPNTGWQMTDVDFSQFGGKSYGIETKSNILNWSNPDYSIGYRVHYNSKNLPFWVGFKVSYNHQSLSVRLPKEDWSYFTKNMIVPELNFEINFGNYRTSGEMYVISIGVRYDYALYANNLYKDKGTVKNGVSGVGGFEFSIPSLHSKTGLYVNIPFYDYFNEDYSPDNGETYPFKNTDDKRWGLELFWRYGF